MATDQAKDTEQPTSESPRTPGNAQGVPVPHEDALEGSSEEYTAVEGVRTFPQSSGEQQGDDVPAAGDHRDLSS
jgi:hypothetical protein